MATPLTLTRDCIAIQVPFGEKLTLPKGTGVLLTQSLGGTYTVQAPSLGGLYRIAGADADALGLAPPSTEESPEAAAKASAPLDEQVWNELKTCYDPEIPVNIVDLGLVYDMKVDALPEGGNKVNVKMTLTAPGCGMGTSIAEDAKRKIEAVPGISEANVELVWDPPWTYEMMTEEGKRKLGLPV
jgi:probable FeS assembly SUF system protein SufT